jgi:hypothetical protein
MPLFPAIEGLRESKEEHTRTLSSLRGSKKTMPVFDLSGQELS